LRKNIKINDTKNRRKLVVQWVLTSVNGEEGVGPEKGSGKGAGGFLPLSNFEESIIMKMAI